MLINFSHAWALFTMINEMPGYMGKVLNFDIKSVRIIQKGASSNNNICQLLLWFRCVTLNDYSEIFAG